MVTLLNLSSGRKSIQEILELISFSIQKLTGGLKLRMHWVDLRVDEMLAQISFFSEIGLPK